MTAELLHWDAPGPYRVAFSTRRGGVSVGAYRSLNLGLLTGDEPANVLENRRLACAAAGTDAGRAQLPWQQHGADVLRARPGGILDRDVPLERCDGLWSDVPGEALLVLTADCLPVALCRTEGEPALAALHAGWRGLLAGILASGVAALGGSRLAAAIGPGIGPCCYAVGDEVAGGYRSAFGDDVVRWGRLDLPLAAERALRAAGVGRIERVGGCTACDAERYFSHRRDQGRTGRQGMIGYVVG
ncbi:MAG: laccase domain-containing protein [Thermoleophilia bacterium]|nr:laccase domain-containing protein [Thermoleophilia bacterium]